MKMTNDVTKRCEDMLHNFADKNKLDMDVEHSEFRRESQVKFGDRRAFRPIETYVICWDEARSLSDVCTNIFVNLTRKWDLDGYNTSKAFKIKNVVFNYPATIILWEDGTKTVVKCQEGDTFSKETGLALCIAKKALGNQGNFNEVFKKWIPEEEEVKFDCSLTLGQGTISNATATLSEEIRAAGETLLQDIREYFEKHNNHQRGFR
jgi:hypothetical protein